MHRSLSRILAPAAGIAGVAALVLGVAGPAAADTVATGGTTTISVPATTELALLQAGIVAVPLPDATTSYDSTAQAFNIALPVTGGNANLNTFIGQLDHSGSIVVYDARSNKGTTISAIKIDLFNSVVTGELTGSTADVPILDIAGDTSFSVTGATQSLAASELNLDPVGASALNKTLHTTFFIAGKTLGSLSTTFTVANTG